MVTDIGEWLEERDLEILSWQMAKPEDIKSEEATKSGNVVVVFTHLKDCLKTVRSAISFWASVMCQALCQELWTERVKNQTWSLIFWRLLTSGRSLSVAPESRIMDSGKQVESQQHHTRDLQLCKRVNRQKGPGPPSEQNGFGRERPPPRE